MPSRDSTAEKHSHHRSNIDTLSLTTAVGTRRESIKTVEAPFWHYVMPSRDSTVVKHSPLHSKVEALNPITASGTRREQINVEEKEIYHNLWTAEAEQW
jgi:hypothetical protein